MTANAFGSSCRLITLCLAPLVASWSAAGTIDFEDLALPTANAAIAEAFTSGGAEFPGSLQFDCCWSGWMYSNSTLNQDLSVSPGLVEDSDPLVLAQRATAFLPPGGAGSTYAISVLFDSEVDPTTGRTANMTPMILPPGETIVSLQLTNTTWAAHSILVGDDFTDPYTNGDFFRLFITGFQDDQAVGTVEVVLADGRSVVDDWQTVALSELHGASRLEFSLASSSTANFGGSDFLNTPAFIAIDNIVTAAIPEPGSLVLLLIAAVVALAGRRCGAIR